MQYVWIIVDTVYETWKIGYTLHSVLGLDTITQFVIIF